MAVRIFVSYSHHDAEFRRKLEVHFAALKREGVSTFYDGDINPGAALDPAIRRELRMADVFIALASPDYLHSEYCFEKEYGYALRRAGRKTMHVVVAVIRPCQWKHTRMARYKLLPEDGKEVTKWGSRDSAFEDIVNGVRSVVKLVQADGDRTKTKLPKPRPKSATKAQAAAHPAQPFSTAPDTTPKLRTPKRTASLSRPTKSTVPRRRPAKVASTRKPKRKS